MKLPFLLLQVLALSCAFSVERVFVGTPKKAEPRLVQDCMTHTPLLCFKTTDRVDVAIKELLSHGFNGAPVIDAVTYNLVGVVSAFDFLAKEETGALLPIQGNKDEMGKMMKAASQICAQTVGDSMTPIAETVDPTTTMKEAAEIMLRDRCHRLCVVDPENGKLVGILSTSDVMADVMERVKQALPETNPSKDVSP